MSESTGGCGFWQKRLCQFAAISITVMVVLVCSTSPSVAQVSTGSITGTVTDQAGAAMVGATVHVHNTDTGVDLAAVTTSGAGTYTVPALQPGIYDITVNQSGFATVQQKGIRVQVGETIKLDFTLPVASTTQTVEVTTEVPILETQDTSAAQTISQNLVADLPMESRRWDQFVLLTPGTSPDGASGFVSFRGLNGINNMNNLEGANYNDNFQNRSVGAATDGYLTSGDAIREFQVSESSYSAELGQVTGGSVNSVVRSGTNDIHGDAFENLRNPIFNALDPATVLGLPRGSPFTQPVHQQNQFGGSVGGPIKKDKLFLFLNYDGYRKVTPIALTSTVTNYNALTCPSEITSAQCSAAKNWITTDVLGFFPRELRQDVALGKLDYQLNKSNHISATYNWRNWYEPNGTAYASANNSGLPAQESYALSDRVYIAHLTTLIGTDKVNELIYQFRRDYTNNEPEGGGVPPSVSLSGANLFAYGQAEPIPQYIRLGINQVVDNFSFTMGRHSLKTGINLNFLSLQNRGNTNVPGAYTYSTAVPLPAASGCPTTGSGAVFCDWLVDLYGVNVGDGKTGEHFTTFNQIKDQSVPGNLNGMLVPSDPSGGGGDAFTWMTSAAYFEDTWKATSNLTLNLGIRYDNAILPPEGYPNFGTALTAEFTSKVRNDEFDFAPRLGIAWNPTKNNVIRVGFGTFFGTPAINTLWAMRLNSGIEDQTFSCLPGQTGVCSGLTFPNVLYSQQAVLPGPAFSSSSLGSPGSPGGNPLVPVVLNPPGNACAGAGLAQCAIRGITPNFTNPRAIEGEVAFQRALAGNMSLTAEYVMTRGNHLDTAWDANLAFPTASKSYDIVSSAGVTQLTTTAPLFTTRIDPGVGSLLSMFSNVNSWYNGMVLTVRKPMSNNVELLANYTLSRATDTGQNSSNLSGVLNFASQGILNPYNQAPENGTSSLDNRHRFTASIVWQPGATKSFSNIAEQQLLGGWSFSTTVTVTSGSGAYSPLISSTAVPCTLAVIPAGQTCASAGGISALDGGMTGALLSAFGSPTGGRAFWLPKDTDYLPGWGDMDLRVQKQFSIHERYHFQLRAEAFNLFNSTIVQGVNENAFTYAAPGSSASCPSSHTNTCIIPVAGFQTPTTTSSNFIGARQLQFGARFEF